jgi:NCS1 family nucleobase:cation symporter-1
MVGQALGLPTAMTLYSFIGVAVTSASAVIFGQPIWDPVVLLGRFNQPIVALIALVALLVATLNTNVAANVVSPSNDFSNLRPSLISFRTGGLITGVVGILLMPWKLLGSFSSYIFGWLVGCSALLDAVSWWSKICIAAEVHTSFGAGSTQRRLSPWSPASPSR